MSGRRRRLGPVWATAGALCGGCAFGPPPARPPADPELARTLQNAAVAFDRGLVEQAATLYEQALARADAADDAAEIASASYNLAACLIELGEQSRAEPLLADALAESRLAGAPAADVLLLRARVARADGRSADALRYADLALAERGPARSYLAQAHALKGGILLEAGDRAAARRELAAAEKEVGDLARAAGDSSDPSAADVFGLRGELEMSPGEGASPAQAAGDFDRQAAHLRPVRRLAEMARALSRAGAAYRGAGAPAAAADRLFRAARSAAAQQSPRAAREWAKQALIEADRTADAGLKDRIVRLLETLPPVQTPITTAPATGPVR